MHFVVVAEMYTLCFVFGEFEIIFNGPVVYLIVGVDVLLICFVLLCNRLRSHLCIVNLQLPS